MITSDIIRSAEFSTDRKHRFELIRDWSDAGEDKDDMSVRKMIGFADRWGYNGIAVTNLRPDVATDPRDLGQWIGVHPRNAEFQLKWITRGALLVAAWGSQPREVERSIAMPYLIYRVRDLSSPAVLHCIGQNLRGTPRHPSRAAYTSAPVVWQEAL